MTILCFPYWLHVSKFIVRINRFAGYARFHTQRFFTIRHITNRINFDRFNLHIFILYKFTTFKKCRSCRIAIKAQFKSI